MDIKIQSLSAILAILSLLISLLLHLQVIDPYQLYFNKDLILHKHEYWRLFTCLFYHGPLGLDSIMSIFFFVRYTADAEGKDFSGRPADFILFMLFGCTVSWAYAIKKGTLFLGPMLKDFVLYYNAKRNPDNIVGFVFIPIQFRLGYLPFILLIFAFFNGTFIEESYFYGFSHLYFFLHDVISLKYNMNLFRLSDKINDVVTSLFESN